MTNQRIKRGDYVRKKSGAFWEGDVVGDYSTDQTETGVNVRLFGWKDGPVQIYPASALEHVKPEHGRLAEARDNALKDAAEVAKAHAVDFECQARWKQNMHECDAFITASNACYRTAHDIRELMENKEE